MALHKPTRPPGALQSPKGEAAGGLGRTVGLGALVVALVIGIQLGSIPWRYRRQIWQLQGFLLGALAGYVLGRLGGSSTAENSRSASKNPPRLPGG
jgi:hypothetical protein